jgi:kynurenine formamidase
MLIDLTLRIDMNDPVVGKANMDQHSFMSAGHIGTHLDSYLQTTIPTEFYARHGKVYDARNFGERDVDLAILRDRPIEPGDFAIFHTGFMTRHAYGTRAYFRDHPQLSWALIDHLIEGGVSFIGIDAAGVRRGDEHGVADRRAEAGGVYIIENLANVDELSRAAHAQGFKVFTGWTGLKGFSGLACRVIAEVAGHA